MDNLMGSPSGAGAQTVGGGGGGGGATTTLSPAVSTGASGGGQQLTPTSREKVQSLKVISPAQPGV